MDHAPRKQKPQRSDRFLRFTGVVIQMGATIALGVWGGIRLDDIFETKFPFWTLTLSMAAVGVAMYLVIRDLYRS